MKNKIAVVGLGYVGLPLFLALVKQFNTIGYDTNAKRIIDLKKAYDSNNEYNKKAFQKLNKNVFTNNIVNIEDCNIYIITVPTPIYKSKKPNLSYVINATKKISKYIKKNNFIIYECTVFPGLIEEICIPLIKKITGLKLNKDFYCGYSPERINPGDKKHTLENTIKIVSATNKYSLNFINSIYSKIITAGTKKVSSIKIAEAAKVIENTQRDLNIAFVNELAIIFDKLNINTHEVLNAASTKWNFLNFSPGLVGGHCIGVDPYYLTYRVKKEGYNPNIILSGRSINDGMKNFFFKKINKNIVNHFKNTDKLKILFLGVTFKENCSDTRNSQSIELLKLFKKKYKDVDVYDPLVNKLEFKKKYNINLNRSIHKKLYDVIIISVPHINIIKEFKNNKIFNLGKKESIFFDFKNVLKQHKNIIKL